ncbi:MAG TPA: hypothetical protein DDY77_03160 [Clostridiales bacterium]|nr:hypothetical protein [Clostridiales bacterium]
MIKKSNVITGEDIYGTIPALAKKLKSKKIMLVYDVKAEKAALKIKEFLKDGKFEMFCYILTNGEREKTFEAAGKILAELTKNGFIKTDCVIAVGGGVTGDLCGLVAALYMRGMKYISVPTTVIAACDSSIGGKTAVDFYGKKNIVGTFYDPDYVLCDFNEIEALPESVKKDGEGEILKYALLDKEIFSLVSENAPLGEIIRKCIDYKIRICSKDYFDKGVRHYLNLGHTVAHAAESLSNFKLTHGEAVKSGLKFIVELSVKKGYMPSETGEKCLEFLAAHGVKDFEYSREEIAEVAKSDKKRKGGCVELVLLRDIGEPFVEKVKIEKLGEYYGN